MYVKFTINVYPSFIISAAIAIAKNEEVDLSIWWTKENRKNKFLLDSFEINFLATAFGGSYKVGYATLSKLMVLSSLLHKFLSLTFDC